MKRALIFPGQGSQQVGMGKELAAAFAVARETFQEIDEALSQHLSRIMFDGPDADLTLTENAQPAIMASSLAILRVLQKECGFDVGAAAFVAGHSLGEYSALAAADAMTVADTARLLKLRGQAMQRAVPQGQGGMAAMLGVEVEQARAIAEAVSADGEVCEVSNDNTVGQVVLSGTAVAIARLAEEGPKQGAKKVVPLNVSAPFHCSLMQPAADAMETALASVALKRPLVPLVANVTAEAVTAPDTIRQLLVQQVTGMVRWRESVAYMAVQGVTEFVEIGAGKVLSGMVRRIAKDAATVAIEGPADIDTFHKLAA